MRKVFLPTLLAFGVALAAVVDASALPNTSITGKAAQNVSGVRQATHQCRIVSKCDQRTKKCDQVEVCR